MPEALRRKTPLLIFGTAGMRRRDSATGPEPDGTKVEPKNGNVECEEHWVCVARVVFWVQLFGVGV